MTKNYRCDNCGGHFGFFDCVEMGLSGQRFILCWKCLSFVRDRLPSAVFLIQDGLQDQVKKILELRKGA